LGYIFLMRMYVVVSGWVLNTLADCDLTTKGS
jgi:hypothetical protein